MSLRSGTLLFFSVEIRDFTPGLAASQEILFQKEFFSEKNSLKLYSRVLSFYLPGITIHVKKESKPWESFL